MSTKLRFSKPVVTAIHDGGILGIRAGSAPHRFLGVWVVVVKDRVFVRPWNDKPNGWRRAFLEEPQGRIQIMSGRQLRVRARAVRGDRLLDAIDHAYATKYDTAASRKWVRGFATPKRRRTTIELVPR
ncbi:MAG TPA: DUF2255 family protein [Gemmatimonadaceae bacterium]